eukprot:COSAG02_NODE_57681_length_280_cov_0.193370_1_plen_71_part_01
MREMGSTVLPRGCVLTVMSLLSECVFAGRRRDTRDAVVTGVQTCAPPIVPAVPVDEMVKDVAPVCVMAAAA